MPDNTDQNKIEQEDHPWQKKLPLILDIKIRVVPFHPPELKNFSSSLSKYDQAVEFIVRTDGPIPAIGTTPALQIGNDQQIPLYETVKGKVNTFRFFLFEWLGLEDNEYIFFGWINDPLEKKVRTRFRFKVPMTHDEE